jgi:Hemopexin
MAEKIVDAGLSDGTSLATFFLTDQYVVYDYIADRVRDGVYPLTSFPVGAPNGFPAAFAPPGPMTSINAALRGKGPYVGGTYFFRGTDYMRFRISAPAGFEPANARPTTLWNLSGAFLNPDAAFNGALNREQYCYFFSANQYVRYVWGSDAVDQNYPKPISNMVGMPASFAIGIDAAVDGEAAYGDAGYLFKDDQYIRFQWVATGEPHVDGPIQPIQGNWTGLAELLLAGKAKSQALDWLKVTRAMLGALTAGTLSAADLALVSLALTTHFHTVPTDAANLAQITTMFGNIEATLRRSSELFRFRTDPEAIADLVPSIDAAYTAPWPPGAATRINFTRNFQGRTERNRASSVIHEAVHFNDAGSATTSTHINEWYVSPALAPALGLTPILVNDPRFATRYDLMTVVNAVHNPASYATFARNLFFRADTRENP